MHHSVVSLTVLIVHIRINFEFNLPTWSIELRKQLSDINLPLRDRLVSESTQEYLAPQEKGLLIYLQIVSLASVKISL